MLQNVLSEVISQYKLEYRIYCLAVSMMPIGIYVFHDMHV